MTEADWLDCPTAERLLRYLKGQASERKLRLFGVACCWRAWSMLDGRERDAVEVVEQFADSLCGAEQLAVARSRTRPSLAGVAVRAAAQPPKTAGCWGGMRDTARAVVEAICHGPTWHAAPISERLDVCESLRVAERQAQADLLRCIFGGLFHPIFVDPAWQVPALRSMTEAAYVDRQVPDVTLDPARLAVLSDALEDAGCAEVTILSHLRAPGPHVRGCWVIDRLLGKE
jgi:hypothetical protein